MKKSVTIFSYSDKEYAVFYRNEKSILMPWLLSKVEKRYWAMKNDNENNNTVVGSYLHISCLDILEIKVSNFKSYWLFLRETFFEIFD